MPPLGVISYTFSHMYSPLGSYNVTYQHVTITVPSTYNCYCTWYLTTMKLDPLTSSNHVHQTLPTTHQSCTNTCTKSCIDHAPKPIPNHASTMYYNKYINHVSAHASTMYHIIRYQKWSSSKEYSIIYQYHQHMPRTMHHIINHIPQTTCQSSIDHVP